MGTDIEIIGQMDNTMDHTFESANRVYGVNGIAPTIPTCGGGGIQPKILECVAMRGRGKSNEQQLEIRGDRCVNSITTVSKDNMVLIRQATKEGAIPCEMGGGSRLKLSRQQDETRKSTRKRTDMSDSDNGEYP